MVLEPKHLHGNTLQLRRLHGLNLPPSCSRLKITNLNVVLVVVTVLVLQYSGANHMQ